MIDERDSNGFLWVIREKTQIDAIVQQTTDKFSISGEYGSGKASGFRQAWYTKTRK